MSTSTLHHSFGDRLGDLTWSSGVMNLRSRNARLVWRGGRAVDCAGLENRKAERSREFESHPLRPHSRTSTTGVCITVSHNTLVDFNAVQGCVAKSSLGIAPSLVEALHDAARKAAERVEWQNRKS